MNPNIPFRDKETALKVSQSINKEADTSKTYKIMEVCGTHTMAIARSGLRSMLPENVELISGPGCPVCVTSQGEIDLFFELLDKGISVASFGDLLRIPGSNGETLIDKRARGADVNVVYSPLDTLKLAEEVLLKYKIMKNMTSPNLINQYLELKNLLKIHLYKQIYKMLT